MLFPWVSLKTGKAPAKTRHTGVAVKIICRNVSWKKLFGWCPALLINEGKKICSPTCMRCFYASMNFIVKERMVFPFTVPVHLHSPISYRISLLFYLKWLSAHFCTFRFCSSSPPCEVSFFFFCLKIRLSLNQEMITLHWPVYAHTDFCFGQRPESYSTHTINPHNQFRYNNMRIKNNWTLQRKQDETVARKNSL